MSVFAGETGYSAESTRPNVIFILADDLGRSELGCFGNKFNETPNIDRLAREGMRMTHAYAAAPVCSPYRASLLTGQYPARHGILDYLRPDSRRPLSRSHRTLAEMFQKAGYRTGIVGKWHLTGYRHHGAKIELRPRDHGFDEEIGCEVKSVGNGANFWPYVFRKQKVRWVDLPRNRLGKDEYLVDRMNLEAVDFIERHRKRPFFLYLSHYATHTILNGKPEIVAHFRKKHVPGKSTREKCYLCQDAGHRGDPLNHWAGHHNPHLAAMLKSIDDGVGMILRKLEALDLAKNTIVIFTSDNGGETNVTSNAPFRGGKSQLYEGGVRVPLVIRWPNKIPARSICEAPTSNIDFYPSLLAAAGIKPDANHQLDGINMLACWKRPRQKPHQRTLFWHYPLAKPHFLGGRSAGAIRDGSWKLIRYLDRDETELFNLANDAGEKTNLSKKNPRKVAELRAKLAKWQRGIGASPLRPAMCEAAKLRFRDRFDPRNVSDRWFFKEQWEAKNGELIRNAVPGKNKRIFVKKPRYGNVIVRLDFCFRGAKEIRVMTGTPGRYNAVVILYPDGFRVTTARDQSVPYFPTIHGESRKTFRPGTWHTLLMEIHGDEIFVRVDDDEHAVFGRHPILKRERDYFALQVDGPSAAFDNVEIQDAAPKQRKDWSNLRKRIPLADREKLQLRRPTSERFRNMLMITRDRLHRSDEHHRELIKQIDTCKANERKLFPKVFATNKELRKQIALKRKALLKGDANFKSLTNAINRSRRDQIVFIESRMPELKTLKPHAYPAAFAKARGKLGKDPAYLAAVSKTEALESKIRKAYPELFRSDDALLKERRAARAKVQNTPAFQKVIKATAAAVRAERAYLFQKEPALRRLEIESNAE